MTKRRSDQQSDRQAEIRLMGRSELDRFMKEDGDALTEPDALAVLANRFCSVYACTRIAHNSGLTAHYSIRLALVVNRKTPQGQVLKFIPTLYWRDLLRASTDVRVMPPIRRALEKQVRAILPRLTVGERMTLARLCGPDLILKFMNDSEDKVFECVLVNPRLHEEPLIRWLESDDATTTRIVILGTHSRWRERYEIRKAIVKSSKTSRSLAASQLLHLNPQDLVRIATDPRTSVYLRRCIERLGLLEGRSRAGKG